MPITANCINIACAGFTTAFPAHIIRDCARFRTTDNKTYIQSHKRDESRENA